MTKRQRKPEGMDRQTMGRIADDLSFIRTAFQDGKPANHHRRQYASILTVLAFVSAAAQAAQQAFEKWDERDAGTLAAERKADVRG